MEYQTDMLGLEYLPNDFTSLPIVIHVQQSQAPVDEKDKREDGGQPGPQEQPNAAQATLARHEEEAVCTDAITDAISDAAENAWFRLSSVVKQTVREACIGLLRRTEEAPTISALDFEYDDDARFLD